MLPPARIQHVAHVGSRGLELRLLALPSLRSRQLPHATSSWTETTEMESSSTSRRSPFLRS
eukprot:4191727-Prymnesium_polylepis.1